MKTIIVEIENNLNREAACLLADSLNKKGNGNYFVVRNSNKKFKVIKEEFKQDKYRSKKKMPPNMAKHLKEIIYLKEIGKLSYREISLRFDFSEATVASYYLAYKNKIYIMPKEFLDNTEATKTGCEIKKQLI